MDEHPLNCPACGAATQGADRFCGGCGRELPPSPAAGVGKGGSAGGDPDPGATVGRSGAARSSAVALSERPTPRHPSSSKWVLNGSVGLLALAALGAMAVLLLGPNALSDDSPVRTARQEIGASITNSVIGVTITVHAIEDPLDDLPTGPSSPEAGLRYVGLDVEVASLGDRLLRLNNLDYTARDTVTGSVYGERARSRALGEATLLESVGDRARGIVAFEVPGGVAADALVYEVKLTGQEGTGICAGHPQGSRCVTVTLPAGPVEAIAGSGSGQGVQGTLRDPDGQPVGGVRIVARRDSSDVGSTTTRGDGSWAIVLPEPGLYDIELNVSDLPDGLVVSTGRNPLNVQTIEGRTRPVLFRLDRVRTPEEVVIRYFDLVNGGEFDEAYRILSFRIKSCWSYEAFVETYRGRVEAGVKMFPSSVQTIESGPSEVVLSYELVTEQDTSQETSQPTTMRLKQEEGFFWRMDGTDPSKCP